MNDVFIYSDESYQNHMSKMKKVLQKLHKAGLKLDIEKSEFASSEVKYLRFIISAEEGINKPRKGRSDQEIGGPYHNQRSTKLYRVFKFLPRFH
jgi:hypothetical protein